METMPAIDSKVRSGVSLFDMAWTKPEYSRRQVDVAGETLAEAASGVIEESRVNTIVESLSIINNWRSSHSYPLQTLKMTLLKRAKKLDSNAVVAQRLKRLSSILGKLQQERNRNMKLSQMQDIGGCRAVMKSVHQVERLVYLYERSIEKNPNDRPEFYKKYDYIKDPKPDGYRSFHYVYKYRTKAPDLAVYNGLRIEIQIRSQLQHAWATAVETVSTFTEQALKSGIGDERWKRFFALMGSALAIREKRPLVPGTPEDEAELVEELRALTRYLRIEQTLGGWSSALQRIEKEAKDSYAFLLVLDSKKKEVEVTGYGRKELGRAEDMYLLVEQQIAKDPDRQAVLVSVDSVAALRSAYPNYYLDTSAFLDAVRMAIRE